MKASEFFKSACNLNKLDLLFSKEEIKKLEKICHFANFKKNETIIFQNALADKLYFLINGKATFTVLNQNREQEIAVIRSPYVPLGISGLNAPGRYASNIIIEKNSFILSLELKDMNNLFELDATLGAKFYTLLLSRSTELLRASRGLDKNIQYSKVKEEKGIKYLANKQELTSIKDSAFFSSMTIKDLNEFLKFFVIRQFSRDEKVAIENNDSKGLFILLSGRVEASFSTIHKKKLVKKSRTIVRSGIALSYTNGQSKLNYPYTIKATRDTKMLVLSNLSFRRLFKNNS